MINRLMPPAHKSPMEFKLRLPEYEVAHLKNNIPVYLVNGGAEDVVKVEWVFKAGKIYEKKNAIASATRELINSGTTTKTAFDISNHFEYYGAYFSTAGYNETVTISLNSLTKHLEVLLPLVRELFTEAVYPEEEITLYKKNRIQRLKVSLEKSEFQANRLVNEALFGARHPYGRKVDIEDIEAIERKDLLDFYKEYFLRGDSMIFVSGKFTPAVIEQLDRFFGDLEVGPKRGVAENHFQPMDEKVLHKVLNEKGVQGAIRLARLFPSFKHPDFKPALVLNAVYGGYFGSRLMSNIREEKGYTYGIYSFIQNYPDTAVWHVATEAGRDVAEAAIEESFKEMEILRNTKVADDELMLVKNYMLGKRLASLDGPFSIMERIKGMILNDLDENYFDETTEVIRNVTADELQSLANKYLLRDEFYDILVI
ncbi:MAG: insulinase family protein [Chitinophagaceae bacterium]|nr:insulinase family protein [Chitinophagaceae bacterium]